MLFVIEHNLPDTNYSKNFSHNNHLPGSAALLFALVDRSHYVATCQKRMPHLSFKSCLFAQIDSFRWSGPSRPS